MDTPSALERALENAERLSGTWLVDGRLENTTTYKLASPAGINLSLAPADVDVSQALRAAQLVAAKSDSWASTPTRERVGYVKALAAYLADRHQELAELIALEAAKPLLHAKAEVEQCLRVLDALCASVGEVAGQARYDFMTGRRVTTFLRPVGPSLLITPWNFPLNLGTRKLATSLLAGCPFVWKPSERTPLTAMFVAEGLCQVGLPAGVASVVPTAHSVEVTTALMSSGLLRKLSFTGSTQVGKQLMSQASEQLMRISLELGGNGPAVIGLSAKREHAVTSAIRAKFVNNGQVCTTINRLFVPAAHADELCEALASAMEGLVVGWPHDETTTVGPLISRGAAESLNDLLGAAQKRGARITEHGEPPSPHGNFVPPTLVRGLSNADPLSQHELFGPVLNVIEYESLDQAIAEANATPYGLTAYAFSEDVAELDQLTSQLRAGMIAVNSPAPSSVSTPFGGIGWSGFGRENGVRGLAEFLDESTLVYA